VSCIRDIAAELTLIHLPSDAAPKFLGVDGSIASLSGMAVIFGLGGDRLEFNAARVCGAGRGLGNADRGGNFACS
jgi:hypothetical protein